jgi:hypothetical protein
MGIKEIYKSISRHERAMLACVFIVVVLFTSVSYVVGWAQKGGRQFLWSNYLSWMDYSVYYSYIHQAMDGSLVFTNYFTSEPQAGKMLDIFWLSVGWFAKITGISAQAAFHLSRIFWIGCFIVIVYGFVAYLFKDLRHRVLGLFFVLFSGGIGAIVNEITGLLSPGRGKSQAPIDMWAPDANTFLTLKQSPHLVASITLMLAIFLLLLLALENNKWRYSAGAGGVALVLFQFHPYQIGTVYAVVSLYFLALLILKKDMFRKLVKHGGIFLLCSFPSVFYYIWLLLFDWRAQHLAVDNICDTPSLWYVATGYGAVLVFAAFGMYVLARSRELFNNRGYLFLGVWQVTQVLLIYVPVNFQRRMILGMHMAMALFAAVGVLFIAQYIGTFVRAKKYVAYASFGILLVLSFIMIGSDFESSIWFYRFSGSAYLSPEKQEAILWVAGHVPGDGVVLSSWGDGNTIVGELQKKVFLGHWAGTVDVKNKIDTLDMLFAEKNNESERIAYFRSNGITHFFFRQGSPEILYFDAYPEQFAAEFSNTDFRIYSLRK